ncbi:MAG: hypothetical protein HYS13_11855 [Planctomycetia bacterium]|nr:hypothetical protein [Planctomycetia bacterium]
MIRCSPLTLATILIVVGARPALSQEPLFTLDRVGQQLSATSTITFTAQGINGNTPDSAQVAGDTVGSAAESGKIVSILGGGGGSGGDGGRNNMMPISGANGADAGEQGEGLDGQDGVSPDGGGFGGKKGLAGTVGKADVFGSAIGEAELNPDNQAVLNWAFLHTQYIDAALEGSGGGGAGGGGGAAPQGQGGNGGDGGQGAQATGSVTSIQLTDVNTVAVVRRSPTAPPGTPTNTIAHVRVEMGWGHGGFGDGPTWPRDVRVVIAMGPPQVDQNGQVIGVENPRAMLILAPDGQGRMSAIGFNSVAGFQKTVRNDAERKQRLVRDWAG